MKNTVDYRKLYQDDPAAPPGLKIAKVVTTYPDDITLVLEGGKYALDLDVFEVPVSCYPIIPNDRLLIFRMASNDATTRYGVLSKLSGGAVSLATMRGTNRLQFDGMTGIYEADSLIIPPFLAVGAAQDRYTDNDGGAPDYSSYYLTPGNIRPLQDGDRVSAAAVNDSGAIKYAILQRY